MTIDDVINILAEFNTWRRGLTPYEWNEDPSKQVELPYSAKEIGLAIDEAITMLKHANNMEREKKYEYSRAFYDGTVSAVRVDDIKVAKLMSKFGPYIVRRSVGEWEEVSNG